MCKMFQFFNVWLFTACGTLSQVDNMEMVLFFKKKIKMLLVARQIALNSLCSLSFGFARTLRAVRIAPYGWKDYSYVFL